MYSCARTRVCVGGEWDGFRSDTESPAHRFTLANYQVAVNWLLSLFEQLNDPRVSAAEVVSARSARASSFGGRSEEGYTDDGRSSRPGDGTDTDGERGRTGGPAWLRRGGGGGDAYGSDGGSSFLISDAGTDVESAHRGTPMAAPLVTGSAPLYTPGRAGGGGGGGARAASRGAAAVVPVTVGARRSARGLRGALRAVTRCVL